MTTELLAISIGIGLVVSLLSSEIFGIASSGMVVPGYIALYLMKPWHLLATFAVAFAAFGIVRMLSTFLIIYGRRRIALMILVSYILGLLLQKSPWLWIDEFSSIGFIIPGLIAVWMDRQTIFQTIASLALVSVFVRLLLILTVGTELLI
ncbi:MAG: poly-gamma-glutamate biosynthesis protein PgsC [Pseudomonadota bacterium]